MLDFLASGQMNCTADILTELNHINDVVCVVTIDMTTPEF